VPLLRPTDPLPVSPRRFVVAGTSGAGKSTLARRIAARTGADYVEIDGLFHGEHWTPRPTFADDVEHFTRSAAWVIEWQYDDVRDLLADRADVMLWLDLPRRTVTRQVVARTLRRRLRREELWNGNTEPPLSTFLTDPEHIVRYAWNAHAATAEKVRRALGRRPELPVVRFTSRHTADRWLKAHGQPGSQV